MSTVISFNNIAKEKWDRIFGVWKPDRFRRACAEQRKGEAVAMSSLPAIQTDKLYCGWDPGLGVHTHGRAHRREMMKRKGAVEAVGLVDTRDPIGDLSAPNCIGNPPAWRPLNASIGNPT